MEERFPMKASSFDAASPYATPIAGRPVLVVESDPDQRRRVTTQLAGWGYTPLAAGTAEEALELLARAGRVAFSVVAIRLPGMSGIDLLRRAGELSASGPVIMVADNGHSSQIVEAIQAGADDFRRRSTFVKVNCAAMPRELLESELFGHERGAFTGAHQRKPGRFELADGGTIFLDEIGELHPALQAKLLHVLQDGEFSRVG